MNALLLRVGERRSWSELETMRRKERQGRNVKSGRQSMRPRKKKKEKNDVELSVCVLWCVQPGQQAEAAKQNQPALTNQSGLH